MSRILVVASQKTVADMAAQREAEAKATHAAYLHRLRERLEFSTGPITDEAARRKVMALCGRLMNIEGRIVLGDPITLKETARLISDILLGEGMQYEER